MSRSTLTADSPPRQPICRFTISRTPPFRLSFHLCVSRCTGVCVFVPCGIFRGTWFLGVVTRAKRRGSVARVCHLTPLCSRTTLCLLSLLHHRGRWVSLTHHEHARVQSTRLLHTYYTVNCTQFSTHVLSSIMRAACDVLRHMYSLTSCDATGLLG